MGNFRRFTILVILAALFAVAGCRTVDPTISPLTTVSPVALDTQSAIATPLPEGPRFTIQEPVKTGDDVVRGTGGAGVPLRVVNLTQMASVLGEGTVEPDGTFEIQLNQSLTTKERIGLMLGDVSGTDFSESDFVSGPGYKDYPFIGIVFTTTMIVE